MADPLLIEIGCEEIPARMVAAAAADLGQRVAGVLEQAGLAHGEVAVWGGPRRLAVRVEAVQERQPDRDEQVLGPPASVGFDASGAPTRAALGFAQKQKIAADRLRRFDTERGSYLGFVRRVVGGELAAVLGAALPPAIASMSFPKTMRWADGTPRWVRPVHWVLALHGRHVVPLSLFGIRSGDSSRGHRFRAPDAVRVAHPDDYVRVLAEAFVLADPAERRRRIAAALAAECKAAGGELIDDADLLDEVADIVEWPGVVQGAFDPGFLDLPGELLATTLRHHQKCFSVRGRDGRPLPLFLAVANTDEDPAGHVRRGNEWVVGGRLDDARFFWLEDRKRPLAALSEALGGVVFHARAGSYADKARRIERLAAGIAQRLGLGEEQVAHCATAARWAKNDLVSGTVGEFPELQGQVGGLLLAAEGAPRGVVDGVYSHYRPHGADDDLPPTAEGRVVSVADKLDSVSVLVGAGETPSGSRDPYALRRAGSGVVRILHDAGWELTLDDLCELAEAGPEVREFLEERLGAFLRERGFTSNEILAVLRPRVSRADVYGWTLSDVFARLRAIRGVRDREDFRNLVKLTQRVDNILTKDAAALAEIGADAAADHVERQPAALALEALVERLGPAMVAGSEGRRYDEVVEILARFIDPVETFFGEVLVVDRDDPGATRHRRRLLERLRDLLTRYFDIRELAGQADRRAS